MTALGASCHTPVGAHAELGEEERGPLRLTAFVGLPDGSRWIRDELGGDPSDPAELGAGVAERLLAVGAAGLLAEAEASAQAGR